MSDASSDGGVHVGARDGLLDIDDRRQLTLLGGLVLVTALAPLLFGQYYTSLLTQALIFSIFAIGVDLLWGYTGVLPFGHAAFFGLGAYITAKITLVTSVPGAGYVAGVLSVVLVGFAGFVIAGVLFYRGIREDYFTIITLTIAIIASQIATSWNSVTGGYNGLTGVPSFSVGIPGIWMIPLSGSGLYYVVVALTAGVYVFTRRTVHSPFGRTLVAIRENERKARALGYDVEKYKTLVFGLSTALGGLAGFMYAGYASFVSPTLLGFLLSTEVLIWVLVGGRGTLVGAIVGTVFLTVFENSLSGVFQFSWTLLLGIALVIIVLVFPQGIVGLPRLIGERFSGRD